MPLFCLLLWATSLLCSGLLHALVGAQSVPTCQVNTDAGRCGRREGGCQAMDEDSEECRLPKSIPLPSTIGCPSDGDCYPPESFCEGVEPEEHFADLPVNLTYSVHRHDQFNVTASWQNDLGGWNFKMMLTTLSNAEVIGCTCGSTDEMTAAALTGYYNYANEDRKSVHLCLKNSSGAAVRYLRRNFHSGSDCESFVQHYGLEARLCRRNLTSIGKVRSLTLNAISPSMLRVSWTKPAWLIFLKSNLYVYDIAYHVTLVGSHLDETGSEIHNFSVTNSTNITVSGLRPGWNYTVTVKTWVWCEAESCLEPESNFVSMPDLPHPTPPTPGTLTQTTTKELIATTTTVTGTTQSVSGTTQPAAAGLPLQVATGTVLTLLVCVVAAAIIVFCYKRQSQSSEKRSINSATNPSRTQRMCQSWRIVNSSSTESASTPHIETMSRSSSQFEITTIDMDVECGASNCKTDLCDVVSSSSKEVLLVGSMRNNLENHVLTTFVPLKSYLGDEVKLLMYNVKSDDDSGEFQRTPCTWVERALRRARHVVCICNREFYEDWNFNGRTMCHEASLVNCVSHHVSGLVNHGQAALVGSKFIVAVADEEDSRYIPDNLRNSISYVLTREEQVKGLAAFLLGSPAVEVRQ